MVEREVKKKNKKRTLIRMSLVITTTARTPRRISLVEVRGVTASAIVSAISVIGLEDSQSSNIEDRVRHLSL